MADSVVGLMIDSDKIRAVEVQKWKGNNPRAVRSGEIQLPPSAFVDGLVVDSDAVGEALRTLWRAERFGSKRVVLSVDGRQAIVRRTDLPASSSGDLRRAAGFDIEELLSYPLDEAIFDLAEIEAVDPAAVGGSDEAVTWVSAIVIAIHQSTRQSLLSAAEQAGLKPIGLHLASESLTRSIAHGCSPDALASEEVNAGEVNAGEEKADVSAVISVGENQTDVVIRDGGGILFTRTLTVGVGVTALNVADELESHLEGLSGYRSRSDGQTESERRASAAQAGVATVVEGVRRTLTYYQSELDRRGIARIAVTGPRAQATGLVPAMSTSLGSEVHFGEPEVAWLESLGPWHGYATAVGAVLCQSRSASDGRSFSLVPWKDQERRSEKRRILAGAGGASVAAALLLSLSMSQSETVNQQESMATNLESGLEGLRLEISAYDSLRTQSDSARFRLDQVGVIRQQEIQFPLVLQEMAAVMPENSQLVSISMSRAIADQEVLGYAGLQPIGVISLSALSEDMAGVGSFVESMSSAELTTGFWLNQSSIGPVGVSERVGAVFSLDGVITESARPHSSTFGAAVVTEGPGS